MSRYPLLTTTLTLSPTIAPALTPNLIVIITLTFTFTSNLHPRRFFYVSLLATSRAVSLQAL